MVTAGLKPIVHTAAPGGLAGSLATADLEPTAAGSERLNAAGSAALKAVEATPSPFRTGVAGRSFTPARDADKLSFVPPAVRGYFGNRRILVVDDFAFTLTEIERDMGAFFDNVTALSDPRDVAQHLRDARAEGQPYDAMVLDLRMPHMNGDILLRQLAEENLLLPTVIHSGSHAHNIQMNLFPQIERMRTEETEHRMAQLVEQENAFAHISSPEDLQAWRSRYVRMTDGVPITFVNKTTWTVSDEELPHLTLARALARVMIVGEETNWTNFRQSVERFKPVLWESDAQTEYIEALVEAGRFMAGKARQMKELLERLVPDIEKNKYWTSYCKLLAELSGPGYSHSGLSGEAYEREGAGARRHGFISMMQGFGHNLCSMLEFNRPLRTTIENYPGLREEIDSFYEFSGRIGQLVPIFRNLAKQRKTVALDEIIPSYESFKAGDRPAIVCEEEGLYISSLDDLWNDIIDQPIINANQWMAQSDENPVVRLGRRAVGSLDAASRAYFVDQHKLSDDDKVVMVAVTDKGPGIPADKLDEIFDRRYSTRPGGTGFGLAFVNEHIGKLNGTYHVESEVGVGTMFRMYFLPATPPTSDH